MSSISQSEVTLSSKHTIITLLPKESSFITSFGLGLYRAVLQFPDSEQSARSLNLLYKHFDSISNMLSSPEFVWYFNNYTQFCQNIGQYTDIISYASDSSNHFLDTLYYIFLSVYCIVTNTNFSELRTQITVDAFLPQITRICEELEVRLKVVKTDGETYIGRGLDVEIFEDYQQNYSLVLETYRKIVENEELTDLDTLFSCISPPVNRNEAMALVSWIEKYEATGGKLTSNMERLLADIKSWTCMHNRKEFITECGKSHCIYCLFDEIKKQPVDAAICFCGKQINLKTAEKIIGGVEPRFNFQYTCEYCKGVFKKSTSALCEGHRICAKCRTQDAEKCFNCLRGYSIDEKSLMFYYLSEVAGESKECVYCEKSILYGRSTCENNCNVCSACYYNLKECPNCQNPTGILKNIVITCIICSNNTSYQDLYLYECKHPAHVNCYNLQNKECPICFKLKRNYLPKGK